VLAEAGRRLRAEGGLPRRARCYRGEPEQLAASEARGGPARLGFLGRVLHPGSAARRHPLPSPRTEPARAWAQPRLLAEPPASPVRGEEAAGLGTLPVPLPAGSAGPAAAEREGGDAHPAPLHSQCSSSGPFPLPKAGFRLSRTAAGRPAPRLRAPHAIPQGPRHRNSPLTHAVKYEAFLIRGVTAPLISVVLKAVIAKRRKINCARFLILLLV